MHVSFLKFRKFFCIVLCLGFFNSCARNDSQGPGAADDAIIAYVNKEPILAKELEKSIELRAHQDPLSKNVDQIRQEELKLIIERKLIIQEAVAQGLARNDNFVDTIKRFWEQTLIREFINFKAREFESQVNVTEEDINQYYGRLGQRVTFKVYQSQNKDDITTIAGQFKKHEPVTRPGQDIGPVGYDEVNSFVLRQAYDLPQNQFQQIEDAPDYYLVVVTARSTVAIKPLSDVRLEIEKRIVSEKEQQLFEAWLKDKKNQAEIRIMK